MLPFAVIDFADATETAIERAAMAGEVTEVMFWKAASVEILFQVEKPHIDPWKSVDVIQRCRRVHRDLMVSLVPQ